ncbi:MAG: DUF1704 domain-containing protein [Actinobacteria bacterium]|nr:DUF1704 domain-containing protein [Actinomycetota bacterium]
MTNADPGSDIARLADDVCARLRAGGLVHRDLPGGRVHIDRPQPFLAVHRTVGAGSTAAERLVRSHGSYLVVAGDRLELARTLTRALAGELTDRFGSVLVLEAWGGSEHGETTFRVHAPAADVPAVTTLCEGLEQVQVAGITPRVERWDARAPTAPTLQPVLTADDVRRLGCLLVGLEIPPVFRDRESGAELPLVLRDLQGQLTRVVHDALFVFTQVQTSYRPLDARALGRRMVLGAAREVDEELAAIATAIDFLLAATPVNADEAWTAFEDAGFDVEPVFRYRPLSVDPDVLKRRLYAVRVEDVEDPTLATLFRAKRREVDRRITMLEDRGSPAFLYGSLQLHGGVDDALRSLANAVLARIDPAARDTDADASVDAHSFAAAARAELAHYRRDAPDVDAVVTVRDDVSGVLVSEGDLLVGSHGRFARSRVEPLIQHEIGTHVVTHVNGRAQPLQLLRVGLPGYEATQEGLAVVAEHAVGGLTPGRLALLAGRVIAVDTVVSGATFVETWRRLHHGHGFTATVAFTIAMRVHRAGGLTKDTIYLRGLVDLLAHLAGGGSLDALLVGKLPLAAVPVVDELRARQVLRPPRVRPRWLDRPEAARRLDELRAGRSLLDLVEGIAA